MSVLPDKTHALELKLELAEARMSKAIAALENDEPEEALAELRGQGMCNAYRCASLKAAHRLLERWRWEGRLRWHDRELRGDTDAFLGTEERMPSHCPACNQALALGCPSCGRKHLGRP